MKQAPDFRKILVSKRCPNERNLVMNYGIALFANC